MVGDDILKWYARILNTWLVSDEPSLPVVLPPYWVYFMILLAHHNNYALFGELLLHL